MKKDLKNGNKAYSVTYTTKMGKEATIIVKTNSPESVLTLTAQSCFTGRDFRNAVEVPLSEYTKTTKQGFAGSNRAN